MSENSQSVSYNIKLFPTIPVYDDKGNSVFEEITDFEYLVVIRQPGGKMASYMVSQANVPTLTAQFITSQFNSQMNPVYQIQIYQVLQENQDLMYSAFVNIILPTSSLNSPNLQGNVPTHPMQMILVDPIIYNMQRNSANFIYNGGIKKSLDVVIGEDPTSYISYIKKSKADTDNMSIKTKVFADKSSQNSTYHQQIVVPSTITELQVPEYILNKYKSFSTPCLWLFDTFNFANYDDDSEPVNGEIPLWGILLNFYNAAQTFDSFDLSDPEYDDIRKFTRSIKMFPFADTLGELCKPDSFVATFINVVDGRQIQKEYGNNPQEIQTDGITYKTAENKSNSLRIECIDSVEEAEKRLGNCSEMLAKQISQVEIYETLHTTPDWLHFGYLYNLETDPETGENLYKYIHTPLSILNIFIRQEQKLGKMEHMMKYSMLRLADPDANEDVEDVTPPPPPPPPLPPPSPIMEEQIQEDLVQKVVNWEKSIISDMVKDNQKEPGGFFANSQKDTTVSRYLSVTGTSSFLTDKSKSYIRANNKTKAEILKRVNQITKNDINW